jgi:potassium-dependent mechanosensitive channel
MNWGSVLRRLYRQSKRFFLIICCFCSLLGSPSFAQSNDSTGKLIEYLAQEKINLTLASTQAEAVQAPLDQPTLTQRQQQNKAMLTLVEAKIASLDSFLMNQRKQQQNLASQLKKLQQAPPGKDIELVVQEQIGEINTLNEINNKTIELINDNLTLAYRYQDALLAENRQLDLWQAKFNEQQRINDLRKKMVELDETRNDLYRKNLELQQASKAEGVFKVHLNNEAKLLLNNQSIILIQYQITELELQTKLLKAEYSVIRTQDIKTLQSVTETYRNAINQLITIELSLKKMTSLLENERLLIADEPLQQQFLAIKKTVVSHLAYVKSQQQRLENEFDKKQQQLKKQLAVRQDLSEYQPENWPSIAQQLLSIPGKFYRYLKILSFKIRDNYVWQDLWATVLYWVSLSLVIIGAVILRRVLGIVTLDKERSRLSGHLYDGFLILLYRNIPHLTLLAIIMLTVVLNHVPFNSYQLLVKLIGVWIIFRTLIQIASLSLLERLNDSTGQDVKFYYRLKWLLLIGGWTTAFMVLSHQLPLPLLIQDIFNRLFMLFLLGVSWVAWRSRDVVTYLLRPSLKAKKRYLRNAISLLVLLVPLILFTTALIGLIGYIHLAWTMSQYQAYLLLLITGYVLVRGLVVDALELLSEWMVASLHNGWLWIEVILKPLDKILRTLLILASIIILFELFGWSSDVLFMQNLQQAAHYPLIDVSGVHITLMSIFKFILVVCMLVWIAKWTREFCYRWLYRHTQDVGIRNSLSVFTQYAVILLGSFITLRVLGLDFSGMSMVLGGLAVGMGFGLRDFASNIVGGIMLLIERPVREGDLITLGEYEGKVAHIGIRSMRVSSWDNMEILIPNAETFSKPFTNWTHQDSVVRTVVPVKVSRDDDPVQVQQIITSALASISEIVSDPPAEVFLKQIDDALIEFEIRFFINVHLHTRFAVRSKLLFEITSRFKDAGIKAPIPPISVELQKP